MENNINIYTQTGIEVADALSLIASGNDYTPTFFEMNIERLVRTSRLTGGSDMVKKYELNLDIAEEGLIGKSLVTIGSINTEYGEMKIVYASMKEFNSGYKLVVMYPYEHIEKSNTIKIHRLKLVEADNIPADEKPAIMDKFFDGALCSDNSVIFKDNETGISVNPIPL